MMTIMIMMKMMMNLPITCKCGKTKVELLQVGDFGFFDIHVKYSWFAVQVEDEV